MALFLLVPVLNRVRPLVVEGIMGTEVYTLTSFRVMAAVMAVSIYVWIFGCLLKRSSGLLYGRWFE